MNYRFAMTDQENLVLVGDDKIIQRVEKINGYELIKLKVADDMIDGLTDSLIAKGISIHTPTKEEPKVVVKKAVNSVVYLINTIVTIGVIIVWVAGIVIASGWLKLLAIVPLYSIYLVLEYFMKHYGIVV